MSFIQGLTSIIIGCYNISHWLKSKKLSCIRNQTYPLIEIIMVDDGSTDETPDILKKLSKEDSRIRIISKVNEGLGSARNIGMDEAKGEFIWFYDVDDEADIHLVERNVELMIKHQTDLNIFSFTASTLEQGLNENVIFEEQLIENNKVLHNIFLEKIFFIKYGNGFAWNKFYRHNFLKYNNIRFGNQRIQQDELFNLQIYPLINRVYISSDLLYHYYIYEKGNTRSFYIPNRYEIHLSIYDGILKFAQQWHLTDRRLYDYAVRRLYDGMSQSILFNTFHPDAPFSIFNRQEEILRILRHPKSQECIHYMKQTSPPYFESRLYLWTFHHQLVFCLYLLRYCFGFLRKIKHQLKGLR